MSSSIFLFFVYVATVVYDVTGEELTLRQAAEQHSKDFSFGTSLSSTTLQNLDNVEYRAFAHIQFNSITSEAYCKWGAIQPNSRYEYDWTNCDYVYNFALSYNLKMTFHTLIWDQYVPSWLQYGGYSANEVETILEAFITAVLTRYPDDSVYSWDIVNEAILDVPNTSGDNIWYRSEFFYTILPNYVELSYNYARQANPNTKLFYNDFNIILTSDWMQPKTDAVYDMIVSLLNNNVPIDGIGFQCHLYASHYDDIINSWDIVIANVQRFADLGLEIHISEVDVDCGYWDNSVGARVSCNSFTPELEKQQAEIYQFLLNVCLTIDACTSYETWGISDEFTWLAGHYPLPFDDNYEPKEAALYLLDTLAPGATLYYGTSPLPTPMPTANGLPTSTVTLEPTSQPTDPTDAPSDSPSNAQTDTPTTSSGNVNTISIQNHDSNNEWWGAFYVDDLASGESIGTFEMRDSHATLAVWTTGTEQFWGSLQPFMVVNSLGRPWVLPLDIRLTEESSSEQLTGIGIVENYNAWEEFDFGKSF